MSFGSNKRGINVRDRLSRTEHAYPQCAVLECLEPTMAYKRTGLNRHYCRRHVDHHGRHGSYSKSSYTATELNPYRKTAHAWLTANQTLPVVQEAIDRVRTLYWRGGRPVEAFRLAGMLPADRAKVVWARLYQYKVEPLQVVSIWLAVQMRHANDIQPERRIEYRRVQVAKVLHRLAGGSHKRWEYELESGAVQVTELHRYPASRGRILRHVGRFASWAAEGVERDYLDAMLDAHRAAAATRGSARLARMRVR